jgi:uncharacterized membrane protein
MKLKTAKPFWQVAALGVLAGMRTTSAPAIASHILSRRHSAQLSKSPLSFMQSKYTAIASKAFAVAELVGDKLPGTPNRTDPRGVAFRCLSGSLAGACIYKASGNSAFTGALIGAAVAFGSTFGSYFLRKSAVEKFQIFDPLAGAIEDALVIGAGVALISSE